MTSSTLTQSTQRHSQRSAKGFCSAPFARTLASFAFQLLVLCSPAVAQSNFKIEHYDTWLEVDITTKSIKGKVQLNLERRHAGDLELDCGDLTVDSVHEGARLLKYSQSDHRLHITMSDSGKSHGKRAITIEYHGSPRRGIRFFPDRMQVYTVFSTSQWMICNDDPDERATLRLRLVLPASLRVVANGRLSNTSVRAGGQIVSDWRLDIPAPTYTFGFVAGPFHEVTEKAGATQLRYIGSDFSPDDLRRIFHDTADMIAFYEERSGVKYPQQTYTQVLAAGGVEQEMSGFTALRESYGKDVLKNDRDIWLGAHELAHQWWGIGVGCQAWTHFWLNEGMASFMADAYKEHRQGHDEYLKEIEASHQLYEKVRLAGKDRSLVFPDWLHPTAADRSLVYDKGAYVLHLLRAEMGEREFWAGIRLYTRKYFGKSVTTQQFQAAMEEASSKPLTSFFSKWVYSTEKK
jgi:aminopeptidase N